ncbi:hypothetical protein F2Q70_00025871 [Brassica cretica]|nr:hypothetical protein F2Q70_00025871 [Brassica cretica]
MLIGLRVLFPGDLSELATLELLDQSLGDRQILDHAVVFCLFSPYCSILSSNSGITCALKSTGVAHSQQASLRQDIAPVILRSRVSVRPEPYSEPGGGPVPLFQTGTAEPGGLMFPEEELKGLMRGNRSGGRCPFG